MTGDPRAPASVGTLGPADMAYLAELVRREAGIQLDPSKSLLAESRLAHIVWRDGLGSLGDLVSELRCLPLGPRHRAVVEALAIPETYFFRDIQPFDLVETVLLPWLLSVREAERRLGLWCGACSTGQEAYSLAMLVREAVRPDWETEIFATDLSENNVSQARDGAYTQFEVNRGLSAARLLRHFEKRDGQWRVRPEVRRLVVFQALNLIGPWPPLGNRDLVFLRNVLMYFDRETRRRVLEKVRRAMRADGFLVLGGGEAGPEARDLFDSYQWKNVLVFRPKGSGPAPAGLEAKVP